jgi:hypothetical protein
MRFLVMRLGPPVAKEVGARRVSVAARHVALDAAIKDARWWQNVTRGRCACWVCAAGQPATHPVRRPRKRASDWLYGA